MSDPITFSQPPDSGSGSLEQAHQEFIALWGQMGSSWGIPRIMAEIHALLFVSNCPMNTDEVMAGLGISRGSASTSLRGLVDWGIVHRVHQRGDRKEYFEAEQDVWKLFRTVLQERKRREIDPLLEALQSCRDLPQSGPEGPLAPDIQDHRQRMDQLIEFIRLVDSISQRFIGPSGEGLRLAARLLGRAS